MTAKIVDKNAKKKMIMDTAIKIFSQKGYFQTTISEIAKEAGIGKGTIYEYFKSKEEIIQSVVIVVMDSWKEKIPVLYGISDLKDLINILKEELHNSEFKSIVTILIEVFLYSLRNPDKKEDISFFIKMSEEHDNLFTSIISNIQKNGGFGNKDVDIIKEIGRASCRERVYHPV